MAKRKPAEPMDPRLRRQLAVARRAVLVIFAVAAILGGLSSLWQAVSAWREAGAGSEISVQRDRIAEELSAQLGGLRARTISALGDTALIEALRSGNPEISLATLRRLVPEAESELFSADLGEAFSGDLAAFGFGRLELLHAVQSQGTVVLRVLQQGSDRLLAFAGPVKDEQEILATAMLRYPMRALLEPIELAPVGNGYIELRAESNGSRAVIFSRGNAELAAEAGENAAQVGDSNLFVAVSVPKAMRVLDYGIGTVLALGVGGLLLGLALLWMARKPVRESDFAEPDLSFAQALEQVEAALPSKPERPTRPGKNEILPDARLVDRSIFRAYDIRGVVGDTLNVAIAELIGQAIGSSMQEKGLREVVVGRDGRLSGPDLADALSSGLRRAGCDVIDIGVVPTPLVYFGTFQLDTGCGVAVTGSHNPPDYNGFKIMIGGETLSGDAIAELYARIAEDRLLVADTLGGVQQIDLAGDYIERVSGDIQLERRMKVVVDAGNGAAGELAGPLLESIGCEVLPLYCDIDGSFPNHHPDPSDPRNLADLITTVQRMGAELGIALDGDGDRIGVVTRKGEIIYPDRLLMLFAQDVLGRNPGASIIFDVKCTGHLVNHILRHGGSPIMWKTGHSLIKAKMKETDAELAGEMSGHFFFRERWFGFDDGLYAAARLLEIIASDGREPEEIFDEIPAGVGTPELKLPMIEGEHHAFVERFHDKAQFEGAKVSTIDGLRADWPDGWGLVRASNTTPALVMRFDADSNAALERIQAVFREQLLALDASLQLPF